MFKKGVKEEVLALIQRMGCICMILMGGTLSILEPKDGLKLKMSILIVGNPSEALGVL